MYEVNKAGVIQCYFIKGMSIRDIARITLRSKTTICNILKDDSRYEREKEKRKKRDQLRVQNMEKVIKDLFYESRLKPSEIAKKLDVSNTYITKIIKSDFRYENEKEKRKQESKFKNIAETKKIMRRKRQIADNNIMNNLKVLQEQNAIAMSTRKKINDDRIVEININHYKYNSQKRRLIFDSSCGAKPNDLPTWIKANKYNPYIGIKTYEEG